MKQKSYEETRFPEQRPLAVITGASTGIGYELAICCAKDGFDLLIAADHPRINEAAEKLRQFGATVDAVEVDLSTTEGVDRFLEKARGRPIETLLANAGHGLGGSFLDQEFNEARHVLDTNVTGTLYLIQKVGREMRDQGRGRILITGSIAGFTPGTFSAVYNGTKAFIDSFSFALRSELKDSGVTVTCLMPGATETEFFKRAGMTDTRVGQSEKDDPADVANLGYKAMMRGGGDVVSGWRNKLMSAVSTVTPAGVLAEQHRKMAEPLQRGRNRKRNMQSTASKNSLRTPLIAGGILAGAGVAYALLKNGRTADHQANPNFQV